MTQNEQQAAFLGVHPDQVIDWDTLEMQEWIARDEEFEGPEFPDQGLDETDILDFDGDEDAPRSEDDLLETDFL